MKKYFNRAALEAALEVAGIMIFAKAVIALLIVGAWWETVWPMVQSAGIQVIVTRWAALALAIILMCVILTPIGDLLMEVPKLGPKTRHWLFIAAVPAIVLVLGILTILAFLEEGWMRLLHRLLRPRST